MLKKHTFITSLHMKEVSIAAQTKQLSPVFSGGCSPCVTFLIPFKCSSPKGTEENLGSTGNNPAGNWRVPLCAR